MTKRVGFTDNLSYDQHDKSVLSVRDGCLQYLGAEIGELPEDKIFTVYRTPATVGAIANLLPGLPITNDHVELTDTLENKCGEILDANLVDLIDSNNKSFIAVKNRVSIDSAAIMLVNSGKKELSLGYWANLMPSNMDGVDFEQKDISPHHLAIVDNGRCGASCAFIDRAFNGGTIKMPINKAFLDDDGEANLEKIVELVTQLPDALKKLPLTEVQKLLPVLQEAVSMANSGGDDDAEASDVNAETATKDDDEDKKVDATSTSQEVEKDDKKEVQDAVNAVLDAKIAAALKRHTNVMSKARDFLQDSYSFKDKTTAQIMSDVVKTQYAESFDSSEQLEMAFRLIKKPTKSYDSFAPTSALDKSIDEIMSKEY